MNNRYGDMMYIPRPHSLRHAPMSRTDRAAQFSTFSALTGYEAAVRETARLTDAFGETNEDAAERLNAKLLFLADHLDRIPAVTITVFRPDERKAGGSYVRVSGTIRRMDPVFRTILMSDGQKIRMKYICEIESSLFPDFML